MLSGGALEQFAVRDACPTEPLNGDYVVPHQLGREVVRKILVKQNAHWLATCREPVRVLRPPDRA